MSIGNEFREIITDLQHASFDDDTHHAVRGFATQAVQNLQQDVAPADVTRELGELMVLAFYMGREHHARGYQALTSRDASDLVFDASSVPDTVEDLLDPTLRRWHVEFHSDVLARNAEEAIQLVHGDDWRVTTND